MLQWRALESTAVNLRIQDVRDIITNWVTYSVSSLTEHFSHLSNFGVQLKPKYRIWVFFKEEGEAGAKRSQAYSNYIRTPEREWWWRLEGCVPLSGSRLDIVVGKAVYDTLAVGRTSSDSSTPYYIGNFFDNTKWRIYWMQGFCTPTTLQYYSLHLLYERESIIIRGLSTLMEETIFLGQNFQPAYKYWKHLENRI